MVGPEAVDAGAEDGAQDAVAARLASLEGRIKSLEAMLARVLPAVLDTAHQTGMRRRHVLLTIEAVKTGVLSPDEFDGQG